MNSEILTLDPDGDKHRFSRFKLIRWWDQERLNNARILVIGAGALGNEILKNLALLGIGNVVVVDMDKIETSNLSRSVLFREKDCGRYKAEVAAERAQELFPELKITALCENVVTDLGLGVYFWADIIIGGLDNREARLAINRNAFRAGKPWIDGAIEVLIGVARVFSPPDGPCYECTMSEVDWKMLHARRACTLLNNEEILSGKTPTTPTISSIIAGIQCQEAIKLIHGMESLSGKGFIFEGTAFNNYIVEYKRKEECYSHENFQPIEHLDARAADLTLKEALTLIRTKMGANAILELKEDVVIGFTCSHCLDTQRTHSSLGKTTHTDSLCPTCKQPRIPEFAHSFDGSEDFLDQTLREIGVPLFDVFVGRDGEACQFFLLAGDRAEVLGTIIT